MAVMNISKINYITNMLEHKENETPTLGGMSSSEHKSEEKKADMVAVAIIVVVMVGIVASVIANVF